MQVIREFTPSDQQVILNFAYQREKENMFVIGSFKAYPNPFEVNTYLGYYENDKLIGLGTFFGRWADIVINAQNTKVINALVDEFIARDLIVENIAAFKRYGMPTVKRLREHGIEPTVLREETVHLLTEETFTDFSTGEAVKATPDDIDDMIRLGHIVDGKDASQKITEKERKRVLPDYEWHLRKNGKIISKANIHATSENYAQIGGVMTHPDHQGKGYAKQTVSVVCKYWIERGKDIILFVRNDNEPALKVYHAIGFQPIDDYLTGISALRP